MKLCCLVVVLAYAAVFALGTSLHTSCSSDLNCTLSGGQCFDGLGFEPLRTCGCVANQLNDTTLHFRCLNTTAVTNYTRALTYTETGGSFPTTWTCHNQTKFCWAQSLRTLLSSVDATIFDLVSNASAPANVSASFVRWRCLDRIYRQATGLTGIRSTLDEYCVECDVGCGIHATCDVEDPAYNCTCFAGYTGDRCTELSGAPPVAPMWDNYTFLLSSSVYNASRPCTECTANERCYRDFASKEGRCYCDTGKLPTTNCTLTSTDTLSAVLWNASMRVNVTFSNSADPRVQWITHTPSGALVAVYSDLNVSVNFTTYRVDSRNQLHATCTNASLFFWSGDPFTSCRGCSGVCGPFANCTASDPFAGTCVCLPGWVGQRCTEQEPPNATCSQALCSSHGVCRDRNTRCECDTPYVGERNCSGLASVCSEAECNGRGLCLADEAGCNCSSSYFGAACQWNASECSSLRCTGAGQCTTQLQGCTCDAYHAGVDCSLHECVGTNGSTFLKMPVTNCSSCETGRNGTHCEILICNGNGEYNSTSLQCRCKTLYLGSRCATSTCGIHGTVVDGPPARCSCASPYVPSTTTNLTTCVLACANGGIYNATADACECDETRFYGARCQFAYPYVFRPRDSENFYILFVSTAMVLWLMAFAVYANAYAYFDIPREVVWENRRTIATLALKQQAMHEPKVNKSMGYVIPLFSPGSKEATARILQRLFQYGAH